MGMTEKRERERASERAIKSEQGRTLNKKGKPKDRRTEKKTEMKGRLKIKEETVDNGGERQENITRKKKVRKEKSKRGIN
jgi:hypothetical protein